MVVKQNALQFLPKSIGFSISQIALVSFEAIIVSMSICSQTESKPTRTVHCISQGIKGKLA